MQFMKAVFLLSCLLIVGHTHVNGFDLLKLLDCGEIAIAAGRKVAVNLVPLIRDLGKCANFNLASNANLDIKGFLEVVNQFLKKATGNQKCLQTLLDAVNGQVQPYVKQIKEAQCLP